jgi:hypothetical protein
VSVVAADSALSGIPDGLRKPLLSEYSQIINNFMERRWTAAELSGGRFCEIVYTILDGHARGSYPTLPTKPERFVSACRRLENNSSVPRSFQILIPRLLPALYEIRNNRNVGHVGGDVDPDPMDSSAVASISSWILAELIRVFHGVGTDDAQKLVDSLSERRLPLVWKSGDVRRVLKPTLPLPAQILLLLASSSGRVHFNDLLSWTEYKNKSHFTKSLRQFHKARVLEFHETSSEIELLPPGVERAAELARKMGTTARFF